MFKADDARRLVANYYTTGEEKSREWLAKHLEEASLKIHTAAKSGRTEIEYELSLDNEKYKLAKKKFLLYALIKLGFKAGVEDRKKKDSALTKVFTVFTITWS